MKLPTDTEMMDWLSAGNGISFERHRQSMLSERTEEEQKTGGYNGRIDFFSEESQHLTNVPSLRVAIATAMLMDAERKTEKTSNFFARNYAKMLEYTGHGVPKDLRQYSPIDWDKTVYAGGADTYWEEYNLKLWLEYCLFPALMCIVKKVRVLKLEELTDTAVTAVAIAAFAGHCKPLDAPASSKADEALRRWIEYALAHREELSDERLEAHKDATRP